MREGAPGSWGSQVWVIIALSPRNLCLTDSKVNSCTPSVCLNNEFKLLALKEDCALSDLVLTDAAGNSRKCQSALNIGKHSIFLAFQGCVPGLFPLINNFITFSSVSRNEK